MMTNLEALFAGERHHLSADLPFDRPLRLTRSRLNHLENEIPTEAFLV